MAEVGAVASVIQIAHFGAQLSITLYNVSQTIKSANQDVKRIAKEIALFAQVLKDLGLALERGQGSKLYRGDAYETSRMIVEECEGVFKEIEEILFRKTAKESRSFEAGTSIPKAERFLWVFRKSRVQLLRSNLESLKSTISLKLAVLTYADKHVSSNKRLDDADEVLSLKSLVLANETATSELREVTDYTAAEESGLDNAWRPGPIATHGIWNILPNSKQLRSSVTGNVLASSKTSERAASSVTPDLNTIPESKHCHGDRKSSVLPSSNLSADATEFRPPGSVPPEIYGGSSTENILGLKDFSGRHGRIWGKVDRLELALKKLEVAIWELERIKKNMKLVWPVEPAGYQSSLFIHLKDRLGHFGLSTEQIRWATNNIYLGQRTEISQTISKSDVNLTTLQDHGITFAAAKDNHDLLVIKRWLPNHFEDILWSHIELRIRNMQGIIEPEPVRYKPALFQKNGKTSGERIHAREGPCESGADQYILRRCTSKAKKDKEVHASESPVCLKIFSQVEEHQQHPLNQYCEPYQCLLPECQKPCHHPDLLPRHMEQQHNNPEPQRGYRLEHSLSDVSMPESDPAHNIISTTGPPPCSNAMLRSATQPYTKPLPTPSHNSSQEPFLAPVYPNYNPAMHNAASQMAAHIAKQQVLMDQHSSVEAATPAFSYAGRQSVFSMGHNDLMTPWTAYTKDLDDGSNRQSTDFQSQVSNLGRTMSAIYQDELFNPASDSTTSASISVQPTQHISTNNKALLSPYRTVFSERLQATNNTHLSVGQDQAPIEAVSTPKTISPKDALLEYYESEEGSNKPLSRANHPTVQTGHRSASQTHGTALDDSSYLSPCSSYLPNPEYSRARIAGQPFLHGYNPRYKRQRPPSLPAFVGPISQHAMSLHTTSTHPAWLKTGRNLSNGSGSTKLEPDTAPGNSPELDNYDHSNVTLPPISYAAPEMSGSSLFRKPLKKSFFLGSTPKNNSPTHIPQAVPEGKPLSENSNLDPSIAAVAASSHLAISVEASNTSATSGKAITWPSAARKRTRTQFGTDENAVLSQHYPARAHAHHHSQPLPPTWSQQTSSVSKRPRKSIQAPYPDTAAHSAALEETEVLSSCFDAPSHRTLETSVVNEEVKTNRAVEANPTVEEDPQIDPDQVVKNLLRKWTTLHDIALGPSYGK